MEFPWSNFDPPFGNSRELMQSGVLLEFSMSSTGGMHKFCDEPIH